MSGPCVFSGSKERQGHGAKNSGFEALVLGRRMVHLSLKKRPGPRYYTRRSFVNGKVREAAEHKWVSSIRKEIRTGRRCRKGPNSNIT